MTFNVGQQKVPAFLRSLLAMTEQAAQPTRGFHAPFTERRLFLLVMDTLCLLCALLLATYVQEWIAGERPHLETHLLLQPLPILFFVSWWVCAYFTDLYDILLSSERSATVFNLLTTVALSTFIWFVAHLIWPDPMMAYYLFSVAAILCPLLLGVRLLYVQFHHHLFSSHRFLIVGHEQPGQLIANLLQRSARLNFKAVGFVAVNLQTESYPLSADLPVLGTIDDLYSLTAKYQIDEIVVAMQDELTPDIFQRLVDCQGQGTRISWMADLHEKLGRSVPIQYIDPTWALCALQGQAIFSRLQMAGKRGLDLFFVLLALPLLLPLMLLVALLIRLDSRGPIFYRQVRVGRGGIPYTICKFRTMVPNAEQKGKAQWAADNDPRITRVGRLLRKARLDELPQLYNILKGEMSLVGPRPERPEFVALLEKEIPYYRIRLLVKPGLTGWAQIHYDYANSVEDTLYKLQYDFYYVRYWSLWLDLYTLFKTVSVVLRMKGT
ncbi:MAG: sugar transferase [Caldilineaceae bacterium]|nr:sugar transferase [Caldilineaceae bacterium]